MFLSRTLMVALGLTVWTAAGVPETLADASKASHPGKALAVYAKLVEEHARFGRYEEAVRLVKRMAGLRPAAEQWFYTQGHLRSENRMGLPLSSACTSTASDLKVRGVGRYASEN